MTKIYKILPTWILIFYSKIKNNKFNLKLEFVPNVSFPLNFQTVTKFTTDFIYLFTLHHPYKYFQYTQTHTQNNKQNQSKNIFYHPPQNKLQISTTSHLISKSKSYRHMLFDKAIESPSEPIFHTRSLAGRCLNHHPSCTTANRFPFEPSWS